MAKKLNVAIAGATGAVGEALLTGLAQRNFPVNNIYALASKRSEGKIVYFNGEPIIVQDLDEFDFKQADIALFSAGSSVSQQYAPRAGQAGCIVIDNSSCFRYEADIPLIIPEINSNRIWQYSNHNIIANPNCATIQMLVALKPLYDAAGIKKINVVTYQSVSGTGKRAINELTNQVGELLNGRPVKPKVYPQQIAFNLLPHIDEFLDTGYTKEEMKMVLETKKIFEDQDIIVNPTAVRVPVLYGHAEAVTVELNKPIDVIAAKKLFRNAPGVSLCDDSKKLKYPTPIAATGKDEVFVGRIRQEINNPCGLNLWIVADNIRKGAATNAIQIAEILQKDYL